MTSPVQVTAVATSNLQITALWIYVDGKLAFKGIAASVDTTLTLAKGKHQLAIQAWNTAGNLMKTVRNITVN